MGIRLLLKMKIELLSLKFHARNPKLSSHTAVLRPCGFYFLFKCEDAVCVKKLWICSYLNDKNVEPMFTLYVYFIRRTTQCEWILLFAVKNIHIHSVRLNTQYSKFQVGKYVIYLKLGKHIKQSALWSFTFPPEYFQPIFIFNPSIIVISRL